MRVQYERTDHKPTPRQTAAASAGLALDQPADAQVVDTWQWVMQPAEATQLQIASNVLTQMIDQPENLMVDWEGGIYAGGLIFNSDMATMGWEGADAIQQTTNQDGGKPDYPRASTVFAQMRQMLAGSPALVPGSS